MITVFTDGSWCPQTKLSGYGVWIRYGAGVSITESGVFENVKDSTTSELLAVLRALEILTERVKVSDQTVLIASNCPAAKNSSCWATSMRKHPQYKQFMERVMADLGDKTVRFIGEPPNDASKMNAHVDRIAKSTMRRERELRLELAKLVS